jgi:hypothetical protein
MAQSKASPLPCEDADFLFSLAETTTDIHISDLGPAPWNRLGDYTSGLHCKDLGKIVNKNHGFAKYRYDKLWVVRPSPVDPMEVYNHASNMRLVDPILPALPMKSLHSVFRHVHLCTLLQMGAKGDQKYPDSEEFITIDSGNDAWKKAINVGVTCVVWSYEVVQQHYEKFVNLMLSDNFESDVQLGTDEFSIAYRLHKTEAPKHAPVGKTLEECRIDQVLLRSSQQIPHDSMYAVLSWTNTTADAVIDFTRLWHRFMANPKTFQVTYEFFATMGKTPSDGQWTRAAFMAWQIAANRTKECSHNGNKMLSNAVGKPQLSFWLGLSKDFLNGTPHSEPELRWHTLTNLGLASLIASVYTDQSHVHSIEQPTIYQHMLKIYEDVAFTTLVLHIVMVGMCSMLYVATVNTCLPKVYHDSAVFMTYYII